MAPTIVVVLAVVGVAFGAQNRPTLGAHDLGPVADAAPAVPAPTLPLYPDVMPGWLDHPVIDTASGDVNGIGDDDVMEAATDTVDLSEIDDSWILQFLVDTDPDEQSSSSTAARPSVPDPEPATADGVLSARTPPATTPDTVFASSPTPSIVSADLDRSPQAGSRPGAQPSPTRQRSPSLAITLAEIRAECRKRAPASVPQPEPDDPPYPPEAAAVLARQLATAWEAPPCDSDQVRAFSVALQPPCGLRLPPSSIDPQGHPIKALADALLTNFHSGDGDGARPQLHSDVRRSLESAVVCFHHHCGRDLRRFLRRHPFRSYPWTHFSRFYCSGRPACDWAYRTGRRQARDLDQRRKRQARHLAQRRKRRKLTTILSRR